MGSNILEQIETNIISWYDFKPDSKILFFGDKENKIYLYLKGNYKKVSTNIQDTDYDYAIIMSDRIDYKRIDDAIKCLKETGVILIAFNNEYGITKFVTYNSEERISPLESWVDYENSKERICAKLEECGYSNFNIYMPFPNYKKTDVILTDKLDDMSEKIDRYFKDYNDNTTVIVDEIKLLRNIARNNKELFVNLSNSYLIEASKEKLNTDVKYVSFNNYRKEEYQLTTIIREEIVEKRPTTQKAEDNIKRICKNLTKLNDYEFKILDEYKDNILYSKFIKNRETLDVELGKRYDDEEYVISVLNDIKEKLLKNSVKHNKLNKIKYNDVLKQQKDEVLEKLHYLEYAFYDMVPKNCFYIDGKYYFFDQEWMEKYLPVEFLIYRSIINSYELVRKINVDDLFEKMDLMQYKELFEKIDESLRYNVIDFDRFNCLNRKYCKMYEVLYEKEVLQKQVEGYKENDIKQNEYIKYLEGQLNNNQ